MTRNDTMITSDSSNSGHFEKNDIFVQNGIQNFVIRLIYSRESALQIFNIKKNKKTNEKQALSLKGLIFLWKGVVN